MSHRLVKYTPPSWASSLNHIPNSYIKLTMTPTPVNDFKPPGTPDDFKVSIKRDDLTGSLLTGSKARKLEFFLAEALENSCKHIITTGSIGSNHCRGISAACVELGLQPHIFVTTEVPDVSKLKYEGNLLISRLLGAHFYFGATQADVFSRMEHLAQQIETESGEKSSVSPFGGANFIGVWGDFEYFDEIKKQGEFDDIVLGVASGGTVSGLAIANYLNGSPYKIHGLKTYEGCDVHEFVNDKLKRLGITGVESKDIVNVYTDYIGLGYSGSLPEELEYIAKAAIETGILFDHTYTGKAVRGFTDLMQNKPEVFKGRRILFLHTGGVIAFHGEAITNALLPYSTKSKTTVLA